MRTQLGLQVRHAITVVAGGQPAESGDSSRIKGMLDNFSGRDQRQVLARDFSFPWVNPPRVVGVDRCAPPFGARSVCCVDPPAARVVPAAEVLRCDSDHPSGHGRIRRVSSGEVTEHALISRSFDSTLDLDERDCQKHRSRVEHTPNLGLSLSPFAYVDQRYPGSSSQNIRPLLKSCLSASITHIGHRLSEHMCRKS